MEQRLNMQQALPETYRAMLHLSMSVKHSKITAIQGELIKIRASQINGCAFCLNMHTKDARKLGETEQRIYTLPAWRETKFFSEEDQAVLALTEEVTLISNHVSDAVYNNAVKVLGEDGTAEVIMAAVVINAWNRIAISTNLLPE